MSWRVGVDSGGTFNDTCLFDQESGPAMLWKVTSIPDDPPRVIAHEVAGRVAAASRPGTDPYDNLIVETPS